MNKSFKILILLILQFLLVKGYSQYSTVIDFFGEKVEVPARSVPPDYTSPLSDVAIQTFIKEVDSKSLQPFLNVLLEYKNKNGSDDWLYYQVVRKVAQYISPKAENYYRYTFYKWWLLANSGYDVKLTYSGDKLLFYVQSDENVYNIPSRMQNGKQYVCLNYHDYGNVDFEKNKYIDLDLPLPGKTKSFSYKVTRLPIFNESDYADKDVYFKYDDNSYNFKIKVNPQIRSIFTNYPVVDYELQCNLPLSKTTYHSLITSLKKELRKMSERDGVEFLMHFTRYAFLFKSDQESFGGEKRMSPEQTLLYDYSDCEDRAALFFYLVKEIYNRPMLVLTYPKHVTIAVNFKKSYGKTIQHNGLKYSVCEPSPQKVNLRIGQLPSELIKKPYEIAYVYEPLKK